MVCILLTFGNKAKKPLILQACHQRCKAHQSVKLHIRGGSHFSPSGLNRDLISQGLLCVSRRGTGHDKWFMRRRDVEPGVEWLLIRMQTVGGGAGPHPDGVAAWFHQPHTSFVAFCFRGRMFSLDFGTMRVCDLDFDHVRRLTTPPNPLATSAPYPSSSCRSVWKYYCRDNFGWREYSEVRPPARGSARHLGCHCGAQRSKLVSDPFLPRSPLSSSSRRRVPGG